MDFKDIFKNLRKSAELTQDELAANLGMSRSAVSMYERGAREPDFETLEAIADYFNVDMNYLTGWDDASADGGLSPELIAAIPRAYIDACGGDVKSAFRRMQADRAQDSGHKKTPIQKDARVITDEDIKFALWGDSDHMSNADLEDVKRYAAFIKERKQNQL